MPKAQRKAIASTNKRSASDHTPKIRTRSSTRVEAKAKGEAAVVESLHKPPLFFWKETESEEAFLSPWYKSSFQIGEDIYQSAGQSILAAKARAFGDEEALNRILTGTGSKEVTDLSMTVDNFDQFQWDNQAFVFADAANIAKFTNGPESEALFKRLAGLVDREFIYADPSDRFFGIGYSAAEAMQIGRENWGLNMFGRSLGTIVEQVEQKKAAKPAKEKTKKVAEKKTTRRKKSKNSRLEETFDASVFDIGGRMSINW